ncbi:uncharacterized protein LOC122661334 [Telopea speciosissima]|uniref:uncharacterized protein LOC122661334 n=1 Tax=Telopea speciosissima TaxID=54955 RepID=UPI001CC3DB52|nr:uncharacterized protein LOC122661334 [Telopea speciosissima]XP_043712633.1 uncharacterized protein LOC122661334 [Telopea speciosissima]
MAFSANILLQNKTLIPLDFQVLKLRNPKFIINSAIFSPQLHLRLQTKKRILASASTSNVASDFQVQENKSATISSNWEVFAGNVSGEWDGHGADFTSEGKPIELPESVVPEAFREWEVQVFDWQTQCPTLANSEERILAYNLIKLLPTVGCEADAATRYSIDERNIGGTDNQVSGFAYHPSGCYVALWPLEDHGSYRLLELEHCLVDPRNRESRVRIIQVVRTDNTGSSLQNIRVFSEQWYGPFRNGEQLGGCALRDSGFASTEALKISEVGGVWEGSVAVASFLAAQMNIFQELVADKPQKSVRDPQGLILLPKQLWCSLKERENGDIYGEVGWLLDTGISITSKCVVSNDRKLKEIAIANETTVSEKK